MKRSALNLRCQFTLLSCCLAAMAPAARAAAYYWDTNGATAGSGAAGPQTWAAGSTFWNADATGITLPGTVTTTMEPSGFQRWHGPSPINWC